MFNSRYTINNLIRLFCIFHCALFISSCSIPNLEKPECTASRDVVKRFYSFHFGNDMSLSPANLMARRQFLTTGLFDTLTASGEMKNDYFTATENYPKAFRVGECTVGSADDTTLQVVLLWRNDNRSEQKEVHVETVQIGGNWLINKVSD